MKFRDLFNEDMTPNYKKIFSIKEFSAMKTTKQNEKYHSEGSVVEHTKLVAEEMAKVLSGMTVDVNSEYYLMMMSAAICHDIGKPTTTFFDTEKCDYTTKYHGSEGSIICRKLFYDEDIMLREKVCFMVKNHMSMHYMFRNDRLIRTMMKLSYGPVTVKDMSILYYCDSRGRIGDIDAKELTKNMEDLVKMATDIKCYEAKYDFDNTAQKNEFFYQIPDDTNYKKGKKFTIYFMIGLPGAGKDTYISKKLHNIPVVSRDNIRTEIGISGSKPQGSKKEEELVSKILNEKIKDFCEKRTTFIINNTNLKKEYRDALEKMILPYKPKIVFIYVEAPSVTENKNRRSGQIQPATIEKMAKNFDFPESYEYNEIRYDIQR